MIPLSVPELRGNEWKYLKECLDTGWVSSVGPMVKRFEQMLAEFVGVPHSVSCSTGTAAIHVGLLALGVQPGDEVLVPTLTFIASVNPIRYCGAEPVFIDSDPTTAVLDVAKVEEFLSTHAVRDAKGGPPKNKKTGRTIRVLLPVHLYGHPVDMDPLLELAKSWGLRVLEDASESLGSSYKGKQTGGIGDVGCFSFNGNKVITTGGGGMVVTRDESIAKRVRYLTTQARDHATEFVHHDIGYNYRLTSIQAALGVAQMEMLPEFLQIKRRNYNNYREKLGRAKGLRVMAPKDWTSSNYWLTNVLLDRAPGVAKKEQVLEALQKAGIESRSFFVPIHSLKPYGTALVHSHAVADDLYSRAISLPSSVGLKPEQADQVCEVLLRAVRA